MYEKLILFICFFDVEVNVGNKVADQQFNANHPFVFYIEDETTGTILYVGRVNNPLMSIGSTLETSTKQFVPVSTVGNSPGIN